MALTIDVKKGKAKADLHPPAVFAHTHIRTDVLEQAIASATDAAKRSDLEKLQGVIAIANGIIAYDRYQTIIASERWKALARISSGSPKGRVDSNMPCRAPIRQRGVMLRRPHRFQRREM